MAQSQGLCVCLPNSIAVMVSEGKSISSDFLRLGRIREPGVPACSFGGLEQHWEPIKSINPKAINPGCLYPSQGKSSSSAEHQRAGLGCADLSQAQALPGLLCVHWNVLGCKPKVVAAQSPVWILQSWGCGTEM